MENNTVTSSGYQSYLQEILGKEPSPMELQDFIKNQDLLLITRRKLENDVYHIAVTNNTDTKLLLDRMLQGGTIQLHSQQAGHQFYSVFFKEQDNEKEHYLMLDAKVETVRINGCTPKLLVQGIDLITIENLVLGFSPTAYNLN